MKKPYMRTIIGSSGKGCVLIKTGLFEENLLGVVQYDTPPPLPPPPPPLLHYEKSWLMIFIAL